jgi:hypothetical protein
VDEPTPLSPDGDLHSLHADTSTGGHHHDVDQHDDRATDDVDLHHIVLHDDLDVVDDDQHVDEHHDHDRAAHDHLVVDVDHDLDDEPDQYDDHGT